MWDGTFSNVCNLRISNPTVFHIPIHILLALTFWKGGKYPHLMKGVHHHLVSNSVQLWQVDGTKPPFWDFQLLVSICSPFPFPWHSRTGKWRWGQIMSNPVVYELDYVCFFSFYSSHSLSLVLMESTFCVDTKGMNQSIVFRIIHYSWHHHSPQRSVTSITPLQLRAGGFTLCL